MSGGPDSTALLIALKEMGRDVVAAHFDHALRPNSSQDAAHVRNLANRLGVQLIEGRRSAPLDKGSLQAAARRLRYEFLEQAANSASVDHILLAHTADDQVEGSLLHLARGSGLAGLRGMPASRDRYRRPLLNTWRHQIDRFLKERGEQPLEDPANRDTRRFARARVRHELLPALESARPGITETIHRAARAATRLQRSLERQAGRLTGDREELRRSPAIVRMEYYRQAFGRQPALNRAQLKAMDALALAGETGDVLHLPAGQIFRVGPSRVVIEQQAPPPAPARQLLATPCGEPECGQADANTRAHLIAGPTYTLATRQLGPGLTMRPAPGGRTRKLQDVLVDAKVPRHLRDALPLVFADGQLAWIPGIATDVRFAAQEGRDWLHLEVTEARP